MHVFRFIGLFLCIAFVQGCKSTASTVVPPSPHQYLYDEVFPYYTMYEVETEEQIFSLDEDAIAFVEAAMRGDDKHRQMKQLVRNIFDRSEFNLLYMAGANTTASQTFHNRSANCLSMSIMTYAMAKEAGFDVRFQDIMIPEYWTRRGGYSILNGHVNLVITPRPEPNMLRLFNKGVVVDFDPQATRSHFPKKVVDKSMIVAMYYNNKGAEALLANSYSKAYAYLRAAVEREPGFDSPWVNLGFLYRLQEQYEYAEQSYQQALNADNDNLTAWENLAYLYQYMERNEESEKILTWVDNKRHSNPFYHFILGEQEMDFENYQEALSHYKKALQLDKTSHEIYFGLAKAYYELGDITRSHQYLKIAERKAKSSQDQERYRGKLAFLSRL